MHEHEHEEYPQTRVRAVAARLQRLLDELQRVSWQIWNTVERQRASDAKLLDINLRLQKALAAIPKMSTGTSGATGAAGADANEPCFFDWAVPSEDQAAPAPEPEVEAHPKPEPRPRAEHRARNSHRASDGPTYLDYLELHAEEFKKFREMPPISDDEIDSFDPDAELGA